MDSLTTSHDTFGWLAIETVIFISTEPVEYFNTSVAKDVKVDSFGLVWASVVIDSSHHLGDDVSNSLSSVSGVLGPALAAGYPSVFISAVTWWVPSDGDSEVVCRSYPLMSFMTDVAPAI